MENTFFGYLLAEALDNPNTEGVEKKKGKYGINYTFKSPDGDLYEVDINYADYIDLGNYFFEKYGIHSLNHDDIGLDFNNGNISLDGPEGYGLTDKGNWSFVYNKLIGCVIDAVNNENMAVFDFSGYIAGMDLIYLKMMNKFNKLLPENLKFIQINKEYWVQKFIIDQASDEPISLSDQASKKLEKLGISPDQISAKFLLMQSLAHFDSKYDGILKSYKIRRSLKSRTPRA